MVMPRRYGNSDTAMRHGIDMASPEDLYDATTFA
jgi:hypothetical protein